VKADRGIQFTTRSPRQPTAGTERSRSERIGNKEYKRNESSRRTGGEFSPEEQRIHEWEDMLCGSTVQCVHARAATRAYLPVPSYRLSRVNGGGRMHPPSRDIPTRLRSALPTDPSPYRASRGKSTDLFKRPSQRDEPSDKSRSNAFRFSYRFLFRPLSRPFAHACRSVSPSAISPSIEDFFFLSHVTTRVCSLSAESAERNAIRVAILRLAIIAGETRDDR